MDGIIIIIKMKWIIIWLFVFILYSNSFSQIYGVFTKDLKSLDDILKEISSKNIIYIGEEHNNPQHLYIQLEIIKYLHKKNSYIAIGMEIFEKKFQNILDSFINDKIKKEEFYKKIDNSNYKMYKSIIEYAREHKIKILALDADRKIVKKVSRNGFDSLNFFEKRKLPSLDLTDEKYKNWLKEIYELHKHTKIKDFQSFYYAQIIRDETMADTIAEFWKFHKDYQIIVISGKGHIIYGYGIPKRVLRRIKISYVTLILGKEKLDSQIGDYIIF